MAQDPEVRFALAIVAGRLHTANGDRRCGCGPCAHWVAIAAHRAGIPREYLESALPPTPRRQARACPPAQAAAAAGSDMRQRDCPTPRARVTEQELRNAGASLRKLGYPPEPEHGQRFRWMRLR